MPFDEIRYAFINYKSVKYYNLLKLVLGMKNQLLTTIELKLFIPTTSIIYIVFKVA